MEYAIGAPEQRRRHARVLQELDSRARRLLKETRKRDLDGAEIAGELTSGMPFLTFRDDGDRVSIGLDDQGIWAIEILRTRPSDAIQAIDAFLLPDDEQHFHELHDTIVARQERAIRSISKAPLVEADGLTCWILALEGMRGRQFDAGEMKAEIIAAMAERRLPTGNVADAIARGWSLRNGSREAGDLVSYWDYEGERHRTLTRIEMVPGRVYEGESLSTRIRFSSRFEIDETSVIARVAALPESVMPTLPGQPLDMLVADDRVHGWGICIDQVTSATRDGDDTILRMTTTRTNPECRLCFSRRG